MTLTQAAVFTKKGIVVFIALIILGFTFKLLFDFGTKVYLYYNPPPEEQPDQKFGKLPKINFPSSKSSGSFSYTLDTKTGNLPQNPRLVKVYFMPQIGVSLLASDRSRDLASKFGFTKGPENVSSIQVKYFDKNDSEMVIDLPTGNFHYDRTAKADQTVTKQALLPDSDQMVKEFKSFLQGKTLLSPDLEKGRSTVVYDGPSQSEAETATVALWPESINDLSIVGPDYRFGLVKATVSKFYEPEYHHIKLDYYFWPVDKTSFGTYSLKSTQKAFEQLKSGAAYTALEPTGNQVSINDVSLAYYQSRDYTPYLLPVYVFTGPNFAAYVSAIDDEQLK